MTRIIAVTACPSGVAHTYMAAESLESAATAKGWQVKVETQGSIGIENELSADDVASADIVILTKESASRVKSGLPVKPSFASISAMP